jgi:hypothetical protein
MKPHRPGHQARRPRATSPTPTRPPSAAARQVEQLLQRHRSRHRQPRPRYNASGTGATDGWQLLTNAAGARDPNSAPVGKNSNTLLIHGGRTTWEGNIAYNDNHVNFETRPTPRPSPSPSPASPLASRTKPDNVFVNEND